MTLRPEYQRSEYLSIYLFSEDGQLNLEHSSHIFTANPIRISTKMSVKGFLKSKNLKVQRKQERQIQQRNVGNQKTFGWMLLTYRW